MIGEKADIGIDAGEGGGWKFEYGENGKKEWREKRSEGRYIMERIDGGVLESGGMWERAGGMKEDDVGGRGCRAEKGEMVRKG
jgi:hypothetical protein